MEFVLKLYSALTFALFITSLHAQTSASSSLPDAPSATQQVNAFPLGAPLVNGEPYLQPNKHEILRAYRHELIGVKPILSAGVRGAYEYFRDKPTDWGKDLKGFAQRYGSAYGESAISTSTRYAMGAALHEDVRYLACHDCSVGKKIKNAVLAEFTTYRGAEGRRVFSPTPIVANFSGPLIEYAAWYPRGYGPDDAAKHSTLGFATRIAFHLVREFVFNEQQE